MTTLTDNPSIVPAETDRDVAAQIELELGAVEAGVRRYRQLAQEAIDRGDGAGLKPAERMLLYWLDPVREAIRQEQRQCRNSEKSIGRQVYGPALLLVDAEKIAVILMHEVVGRCMASEPAAVSQVAYAIGSAVIAEASAEQLRKNHKTDYEAMTRRARSLTVKKVIHWSNKCLSDPIWSRRVAMHMGGFLLWLFIQNASAGGYGDGEFKLAFRRVTKWIGKKRKSFVEMDKFIHEELERGHVLRQMMRPCYAPMVVAPRLWSRKVVDGRVCAVEGGYRKISTPYISKPTRAQKDALASADLTIPDACLNSLGRVPWAVNHAVVDVIEEIYSRGGGMAGVPRLCDRERPARPANGATEEEIKVWKREASKIHHRNRLERADRTGLDSAFRLADKLSSRDRFYQPHQYDFRSRVIPVVPNFNHHKNDLIRSMMKFGRPVDAKSDDARWWLYVHIANCAGYDKVSFPERVSWTDEWIRSRRVVEWIGDRDKIVDVADHTWAGDDIDSPLQFLAGILAVFDPQLAATLPIQMDGTCSALQHYAALAGDHDAAKICNLVDSPLPSGVYALVATEMNRLAEIDATGSDPAKRGPATIMRGRCTKDFSKASVMTTRYGATAYRVHDQMFTALIGLAEKNPSLGLTDMKVMNSVAVYLRGIVIEAIGSLCKSADRIMHWVQQSAHAIAKSGEVVRWTTPIGFPVVQPYKRYTSVKICTILQEIYTMMEDEKVPVWVSKQARSCAPNFIHSLDATHALTTSLACDVEGIDLAMVHDSFWSHAANTGRCGELIRQKFVDLHTEDQAQRVYLQWRAQYPKVKLQPPPARGDFDLSHVLKARHAFS